MLHTPKGTTLASVRVANLGLEASNDGFATKVSRRDDPLFWIRIETPIGDEIVVTDFKTEMLELEDQVSALIFGLVNAGAPSVDAIRFCDIAPGHSEGSERENAERDRYPAMATVLATRLGKEVARSDFVSRRGKLDFTVELSRRSKEPIPIRGDLGTLLGASRFRQ